MAEHEELSQGTPLSSEDEITEDFDSALGSETSSISQTLASSTMDYQFEDGRRYHAYQAGKYNIPNDEPEVGRLDLQHKIWSLTLMGELFRAPIDPNRIQKALDVGTGTGIWAIEFADKYPNCQVIGTDLSPIQPTWVPPNCQFLVDDADADQEWTFGKLDFIHSRMLVAGFKAWERFIRNAYANLAPGGWIELLEVEMPITCSDGSVTDDEPLMKWSRLMADAVVKAGGDPQAQNKFLGYLKDSGFINITREDYQWPIGPWDPEETQAKIGTYMLHNTEEFTRSTQAFFTRVLGWTTEEAAVFQAQCKESIWDSNKHRYSAMTIHYAQKPFEEKSGVEEKPAMEGKPAVEEKLAVEEKPAVEEKV